MSDLTDEQVDEAARRLARTLTLLLERLPDDHPQRIEPITGRQPGHNLKGKP